MLKFGFGWLFLLWGSIYAQQPLDSCLLFRNWLNQQQPEKVIQHFQNLSPQSVCDWENMGYAFQQMQQPDKALSCFQKALSLQPSYVTSYINISRTFTLLEMPDSAEFYKSQAMDMFPDAPEPKMLSASMRKMPKELLLAEVDLNKAVATGHVPALIQRGHLFLYQGLLNKAMDDAQNALTKDSTNAYAYDLLAQCLYALGDTLSLDLQLPYWRSQFPHLPVLYILSGHRAFQKKMWYESLNWFLQAWKFKSQRPSALAGLIPVLLELKDAEALCQWKDSLIYIKKYSELYHNLMQEISWICHKNSLSYYWWGGQKSTFLLQEGILKFPQSALLWSELTRHYLIQQNWDSAKIGLASLQRIKDDSSYINLEEESQSLPDSIKKVFKSFNIEISTLKYAYFLNYHEGNYKSAALFLKKLADITEDKLIKADVYILMADIYRQTKNKKAWENALLIAFTLNPNHPIIGWEKIMWMMRKSAPVKLVPVMDENIQPQLVWTANTKYQPTLKSTVLNEVYLELHRMTSRLNPLPETWMMKALIKKSLGMGNYCNEWQEAKTAGIKINLLSMEACK